MLLTVNDGGAAVPGATHQNCTPRPGPGGERLTWSVRTFQDRGPWGYSSLAIRIRNDFTKSTNMFASPILRALGKEPTYVDQNPYRAKRLWPPDFAKLSPKDQFKLERRYRRRSKLAWARPKWTKYTKIAQLSMISCTAYDYELMGYAN